MIEIVKYLSPRRMIVAVLLTAGFLFSQAEQGMLIDKSGESVPLDLSFVKHTGDTIELKEIFDRPVILILVYYRCASLCNPLLREVTKVMDKSRVLPGEEYRIVTVSFDHGETPKLATNSHHHMHGMMKTEIPIDSWMFLTGDSLSIDKLCKSVGFSFLKEKQDFAHPVTLIAVSKSGTIIRYLNGLEFLPVDIELAVLDAKEERVRSFMQKIQRVCYTYDSTGKKYILQINKLILFVSLGFVGLFILFLVMGKKSVDKKGSGTK
ncbi:MAG: SCO family protein [Fibrobacteria bacterium]|nr:SCO family protein [Fibrobacteria bacterium]